jgi:hypothetical protein
MNCSTALNKKICIIYANCQGRGIKIFLQKHPLFNETIEIITLESYIFINEQLQLPIDLFKTASFFIYQPVDNKYGYYATDHVKSYLPEHCQSISFPYIYNNALWPLFEDVQGIVGQEAISKLFEQGYSLKQVTDLFFDEAIDFKFEERFKQSISILKEKERMTDISISDFIACNLRKNKLFLTQNHPTSIVFVYCVNQMLRRLGFSVLPETLSYHVNEASLPDCWPLSPYEKKFYGYQYNDDWQVLHPERKDSNWYKFHLKIIGKIYFKNKILTPKLVFERFYLRIMMAMGLRRRRGYLEERYLDDQHFNQSRDY